jgi:hypothetical protein
MAPGEEPSETENDGKKSRSFYVQSVVSQKSGVQEYRSSRMGKDRIGRVHRVQKFIHLLCFHSVFILFPRHAEGSKGNGSEKEN